MSFLYIYLFFSYKKELKFDLYKDLKEKYSFLSFVCKSRPHYTIKAKYPLQAQTDLKFLNVFVP